MGRTTQDLKALWSKSELDLFTYYLLLGVPALLPLVRAFGVGQWGMCIMTVLLAERLDLVGRLGCAVGMYAVSCCS